MAAVSARKTLCKKGEGMNHKSYFKKKKIKEKKKERKKSTANTENSIHCRLKQQQKNEVTKY